jgi:hypothetical protein
MAQAALQSEHHNMLWFYCFIYSTGKVTLASSVLFIQLVK